MAYYRSKNPSGPENNPDEKVDLKEVGRAAWTGFWQGIGGNRNTYEQHKREQRMKQRGFPPRKPNWFERLMGK